MTMQLNAIWHIKIKSVLWSVGFAKLNGKRGFIILQNPSMYILSGWILRKLKMLSETDHHRAAATFSNDAADLGHSNPRSKVSEDELCKKFRIKRYVCTMEQMGFSQGQMKCSAMIMAWISFPSRYWEFYRDLRTMGFQTSRRLFISYNTSSNAPLKAFSRFCSYEQLDETNSPAWITMQQRIGIYEPG